MPNSKSDKVIFQAFKGIAVFTPGGDFVYCRDYEKKSQWHLNLCGALQEHLGLVESPHFLVPCFTATVDCWQDSTTRNFQVAAEAYPFVYPYQELLNAVFELGHIEWQRVMPNPEYRNPLVFETYRSHFPQLWESHELVLDISETKDPSKTASRSSANTSGHTTGVVLKLFVSGYSLLTEQILTTLQSVLESSRYHPYTLQMVDVSKNPEQAELNQIAATPTLMRVSPTPVRRLVGEFNDPRAILSLLGEL